MTFAQKRKRAARRVLNGIDRKLRKIYNHNYHFDQTEEELLKDQTFYLLQEEFRCNALAVNYPMQPTTLNCI